MDGVEVGPGGTSSLPAGTLLAGDVNDDNVVNGADFSLLAATFSKVTGDDGYDARADFTFDDVVNGADFSLLATNYLHPGDTLTGAPDAASLAAFRRARGGGAGSVRIAVDPSTSRVAAGETFAVDNQSGGGEPTS